MSIDFKNYKKDLEKSVKNYEVSENKSLKDQILNEFAPLQHNMKQKDLNKIVDDVFCDPDLKSLLNYEKELYGARTD